MPNSFSSGSTYCSRCTPNRVQWKEVRRKKRKPLSAVRAKAPSTQPSSPLFSDSASEQSPSSPYTQSLSVRTSPYQYLTNKTFLGKGGQATVYRCLTKDGEEVVSKDMQFSDDESYHRQLQQATAMMPLHHPHLIKYLDVFHDDVTRQVSIILPYYAKGDLRRLIFDYRGYLPAFRLCSLVLQLTTALEYLHCRHPPLVHGDVKPENVLLLNNEEQILLMDLDLCSEEDRPHSRNSRTSTKKRDTAYTCEYSAPELRLSQPRTVKSDIFSLGVVTYALAALPSEIFLTHKGNALLLSDEAWKDDFETLERLVRSAIRRRCSSYPPDLSNLIVDMLRWSPARRPHASDVKRRLSDMMVRLL